ncbi:hypothetical protein NDU88_008837 [Pleurodeles waltl]|uniref:Uncharacterized protein n=1 Tax=Pleurodeles waltl TaxID=8319 RepID=A0AAV7PQZ2_PLEWA|nr:hypothetical protein NDU88_008837 [Pleurodeles waltl]
MQGRRPPRGSRGVASPTQLPSAPPGLGAVYVDRARRNQGRVRHTVSKCNVSVGAETHQGPQPSPGAPGTHNSARRPERGRPHTRAAHSVLAAARLFTRGRGFQREEGPQASSRAGRPVSVPCSPRVRSAGSAAPPTGPQFSTRALRRNGPGWHVFQEFCRRPLRSEIIRRTPCSEPWPRPPG